MAGALIVVSASGSISGEACVPQLVGSAGKGLFFVAFFFPAFPALPAFPAVWLGTVLAWVSSGPRVSRSPTVTVVSGRIFRTAFISLRIPTSSAVTRAATALRLTSWRMSVPPLALMELTIGFWSACAAATR